MSDFKDLVQRRRSHRAFTDEEVDSEDVRMIMRAALMSPTSKGQRNWQFFVVDNKPISKNCLTRKKMVLNFLKNAPLAIIVMGNLNKMIVGSRMLLSLPSVCNIRQKTWVWVVVGFRCVVGAERRNFHNDIIHGILGIPSEQQVVCILAIGHKANERKLQNEEQLKWENVL